MTVGSSDLWPVTMCRLRPREWNWLIQGHSGFTGWSKTTCIPAQSSFSCIMRLYAFLSGDSGGGIILLPVSVMTYRTSTLFFSARAFISLFLCSSHLLTHPEIQKRRRNLSDPWKILLPSKPVPTPPCFVPSWNQFSLACHLSDLHDSGGALTLSSPAGSPCLSQNWKFATVP